MIDVAKSIEPVSPTSLRRTAGAVLVLGAIIGLPLIGGLWAGRDVAAVFQFPPPLAIPTDYPRFSWMAVSAVLLLLAVVTTTWIVGSRTVAPAVNLGHSPVGSGRRFPWWGWAAIVWVLMWWLAAWTRWPWFAPLQRYTFFPLWLGFTVVISALAESRGHTCLMRRAPRLWLGLFAASAGFWWLFEWLNRFVHNWHYLAAEDFGAVSYAVHATLCFSTVLPAVHGVAEWLGTTPSWVRSMAAGPAWVWFDSRRPGLAFCVIGSAALVLTGAYPEWLYPSLWVAPLLLVLGYLILTDRGFVAREIAAGDWRRAGTWMAASLICGFWWELWNWHSLAKWIYTVPGVERWHVFEMPLLGYAGYLPFGLECLLIADVLEPTLSNRGNAAPSRAGTEA